MSSSKPFHLRSGIYEEEEAKRLKEQERVDDTKVTVSTRHNRTDTHINSQRLWQHVQGQHRFKPDGSQMGEGEVDMDFQP